MYARLCLVPSRELFEVIVTLYDEQGMLRGEKRLRAKHIEIKGLIRIRKPLDNSMFCINAEVKEGKITSKGEENIILVE
ncbi:MAG: hypothetical protein DRO12_01895 [Thermoprotei archaeon]|nr:MAG: hypothetical protein DRO12_01895 [Thermoprotei archaeon]